MAIAAALSDVVTPANEFCCDGGTAIVAFARRAGIAAHGRLKEWLRRFHGVATKNLPNYLGWRRTLEALGSNATSAKIILGAIGMGPYQQQTP
jgi:hypothetical protein